MEIKRGIWREVQGTDKVSLSNAVALGKASTQKNDSSVLCKKLQSCSCQFSQSYLTVILRV
jgi:hypothetical protein